MTTQQIKKELLKRDVIIYSLRKVVVKKDVISHTKGYIATYAIIVSENCTSTQEDIWVENKVDLLEKFN